MESTKYKVLTAVVPGPDGVGQKSTVRGMELGSVTLKINNQQRESRETNRENCGIANRDHSMSPTFFCMQKEEEEEEVINTNKSECATYMMAIRI